MKPSQFHTLKEDKPLWPIILCLIALFILIYISCNPTHAQIVKPKLSYLDSIAKYTEISEYYDEGHRDWLSSVCYRKALYYQNKIDSAKVSNLHYLTKKQLEAKYKMKLP